jgi:YgiT-type zinc finger domain-containing protein
MNCLICRQARLVVGLASVQFGRGEMQARIDQVPARVCPGCGEAYVEKDVAEALLLQANALFETGTLDSVTEYNNPT